MPSPSLAEQVLDLIKQLREVLPAHHDPELPMSVSDRIAAGMLMEHIENAAYRRLEYSKAEKARRADSTAGLVIAPRGHDGS